MNTQDTSGSVSTPLTWLLPSCQGHSQEPQGPEVLEPGSSLRCMGPSLHSSVGLQLGTLHGVWGGGERGEGESLVPALRELWSH